MTGLACSRGHCANSDRCFSRAIQHVPIRPLVRRLQERAMITGHEYRRSLYDTRREWHRVLSVNELRALRRATGLGQREFAAELAVALETFRTWDSGRRPVPTPVLQKARAAVAHPRHADVGRPVQRAQPRHRPAPRCGAGRLRQVAAAVVVQGAREEGTSRFASRARAS